MIPRNTRWLSFGAWLLCVLALSSLARAAVPSDVSYQGLLLDANGQPETGPVNVTVRVFDLPSGGAPLYQELHSGVSLTDGVFQILLGTGSAQAPAGGFGAALFGGVNRWLEVEVDGEVLAPRQVLSSVAYALQAQNAATLSGTALAGLVAQGQAGAITAPMIASGAVGASAIANGAVVASKIADGTVTAAKLVDGAGSGIDADSLDGIDGATITALQVRVATLEAQLAAVQALLAGVSRVGTSTLRFTGLNVQIVDGTGSTDGPVNGLGNLLIGYNAGGTGVLKTGSHNLVVGDLHSYESYGGLVAGAANRISAPWAVVSGGNGNHASAIYSSVTGGSGNEAGGQFATVTGGQQNDADGVSASVSGGSLNRAANHYSSVTGGSNNTASGVLATVSGGKDNVASGNRASVAGGQCNLAGPGATPACAVGSEDYMVVSGGYLNWANAKHSAVAGGQRNQTNGGATSILGGFQNVTSNFASTVSGGSSNTATGSTSSVSGGTGITASANNGWKAGTLSSP